MIQRDTYIDIAKGIAMLLVVRVHTEVFGAIGTPYPIIAVPFFFFLSGLYDRSEKPLKQWLPKTAMNLLGTAVIWSAITFVFHSTLTSFRDHSLVLEGYICTLTRPPFSYGATWFLVALFISKLLTASIARIKFNKYLALLIIFVCSWLVSNYNLPCLLDEGMSAWIFYYTGKILYPYLSRISENRFLILGGAISLIVMAQGWYPYVLVTFNVDSGIWLYPMFTTMAISGFVPILYISKVLERYENYKIVNLLTQFGQCTLGVLVVHPLVSHLCAITLKRIFIPQSTAWIATFLVAYILICLVSFYLTIIIKRFCPILLGSFPSKTQIN